MSRLPKSVSDEVDQDPTGKPSHPFFYKLKMTDRKVDIYVKGAGLMHEKGYLQGAPHKVRNLVHFHLNDIPTSIEKTTLVPGGREVLRYVAVQGTVGILVPFSSKEDVDFFLTLEMQFSLFLFLKRK